MRLTSRFRLHATLVLAALLTVTTAAPTAAQSVRDAMRAERELVGEGWRGFTNVALLGEALLSLSLATVLGALLAYHPRRRHTVDSVAAADAPKVFILYAVIGAVIGMMVLKYGVVVGFVVFGIGGLTRFRTDLSSAPDTGRLIFITLVGLSCGLELPHLAVLSAAFGFVLLMVLDAHATYHVEVKGLAHDDVAATAAAYRDVLEGEGCRIIGERKSFAKKQVEFIFHAPHALQRDGLVQRLESDVPERLRGVVDWGVN